MSDAERRAAAREGGDLALVEREEASQRWHWGALLGLVWSRVGAPEELAPALQ